MTLWLNAITIHRICFAFEVISTLGAEVLIEENLILIKLSKDFKALGNGCNF